jgi:hypothetical protein
MKKKPLSKSYSRMSIPEKLEYQYKLAERQLNEVQAGLRPKRELLEIKERLERLALTIPAKRRARIEQDWRRYVTDIFSSGHLASCMACSSKGVLTRCQSCFGSGKTTDTESTSYRLCNRCQGTGGLNGGCTSCENGWQVERLKTCNECSGSGQFYRQCSRCNGIGVVGDIVISVPEGYLETARSNLVEIVIELERKLALLYSKENPKTRLALDKFWIRRLSSSFRDLELVSVPGCPPR